MRHRSTFGASITIHLRFPHAFIVQLGLVQHITQITYERVDLPGHGNHLLALVLCPNLLLKGRCCQSLRILQLHFPVGYLRLEICILFQQAVDLGLKVFYISDLWEPLDLLQGVEWLRAQLPSDCHELILHRIVLCLHLAHTLDNRCEGFRNPCPNLLLLLRLLQAELL